MFPLTMSLEVGPTIDEDSVIRSLRERRCEAFAFGVQLADRLFQRRLPLLRLAERGRTRLAAVKRYAKGRLSPQSGAR
jgi:hypothetical protein